MKLDAGKDVEWRSGWVAHYHEDCWQEVRDALFGVIEGHRSDLRRLERIPVAQAWEIRTARAGHHLACGRGGGTLSDDLRAVLEHLAPGVRHALPRAGITSLDEAARLTDEQLLALPRVGHKTVALLRSAIADRDSQPEIQR